MASFARIDKNNVVVEVLSVNNEVLNDLPFPESEPFGVQFLTDLLGRDGWKQTSYNANFRVHFAGINYTYDPDMDIFLPPKPYPSWILNGSTFVWEPPSLYPTDGKIYQWNEETQSWVEFTGE